MGDNAENEDAPVDAPGEASLLVSEFPPPPFYYAYCGEEGFELEPPPIPQEKLTYATEQARQQALQQAEKEEKIRQGLVDDPQSFLTGDAETPSVEDDKVVGVFGEVVEDPFLMTPIHSSEEDPLMNCEELKRLNTEALETFVQLVNDLVQQPLENKKSRDLLSRKIHLMLLESNKLREHQARDTLIKLLEQQLAERRSLTRELDENVKLADHILG